MQHCKMIINFQEYPDAKRAAIRKFTLCKPDRLCYSRALASAVFPGSSAVEQPAVNRLVAGSNPARGANIFNNIGQSALKSHTSKTNLAT